MFVPVTHIHPLAKFRRACMLPEPGSVLAQLGQQLQVDDVFGQTPHQERHILIDVPGLLGIPQGRFRRKLITRNVGDRLLQGDVLAETQKSFNRVLRAPADGVIIMISHGRVLYELTGGMEPVLAGYPGTVVEVIPDRGVILEINGALIQGAWGNGKTASGPLLFTRTENEGMLSSAHIDGSLRGKIGVAGQCRERAALLAAAELPMKGLILGSMSSDLIEMALQLKLPVILLEGFTGTGINQTAARILFENENREVCVHAIQRDRYRGERPEVIIPLAGKGVPLPDVNEYQAGRMVRVHEEPNQSAIGIIDAVYQEPVQLQNGLWAKIASIRLENNKKITIPVVNLEVLD